MTTWTGLQVGSPNGGSVEERVSLLRRFQESFSVNPALTSKMVSYQGNRGVPGFRWLKYKEGFSSGLVEHLLENIRPTSVLDPFSGIGTTPIVAASKGLRATGIEIVPVAALTGKGIALASSGLDGCAFREAASLLVQHAKSRRLVSLRWYPKTRQLAKRESSS